MVCLYVCRVVHKQWQVCCKSVSQVSRSNGKELYGTVSGISCPNILVVARITFLPVFVSFCTSTDSCLVRQYSSGSVLRVLLLKVLCKTKDTVKYQICLI